MCEHAHNCHIDHHHNGILGKYSELIFAILCGLCLVFGYGLSFGASSQIISLIFYVLAFFLGSFFTVQEAYQKLLKGKFEIDFLMLLAACGSAYLDKWVEGALLLFLFSLGHALEHYALSRAKKSISALGNLTPEVTLIKQKDGLFKEIPVKDLQVGHVILIKAHQQIAADGVVIKGQTSVNQAPITGESIAVDKSAFIDYNNQPLESIEDKYRVFAGTLNGSRPIEVKVLRHPKYSTLSRLIEMVSEAQAKQSPTQRFTKRIEKYYVPSVLLLVFLLCFFFLLGTETFDQSFYRALTVLVASSPCALAISTPGTVLSGIARAAQRGILFKGGGALEDLGGVQAIAFDKTGTLTEGKPKVVEIIPHSIALEELLTIAFTLESFTNHPLALAIVDYAKPYAQRMNVSNASVKIVEGNGVEASIDNRLVKVGKLSYLGVSLPQEIEKQKIVLEEKGYTLVGVAKDKTFLGLIALFDKPKEHSKKMLQQLRKLGLQKIVMLTGDQQAVADTVGEQLELKEVYGALMPEDKVLALQKLNAVYRKTAMIGDGINDAPAMATSTVSVAMGAAGSDIALETSDIALLSDNIQQLPFAVGLSRKAKAIIQQNLFISLGSIALLIPMAIMGITGIGATIILHEGTTIVVILNALRLLSYKE